MFVWLSEYLEKRKEEQAQEHWEDGYDWAAGQLLRGEATPMTIDDKLSIHHPFDRGAATAVNRLVELKLVEDDRV